MPYISKKLQYTTNTRSSIYPYLEVAIFINATLVHRHDIFKIKKLKFYHLQVIYMSIKY
jgi:hypothetical protein